MKPNTYGYGEIHVSPFFFTRIIIGWCFENNYIHLESSFKQLVLKTPYELMSGKKIQFNAFLCLALYALCTRKFDSKTITGFFIDY